MLTDAQLAARTGKLTGSRIKCLMRGDEREILRLYYELTDDPRFEPEELDPWPIERGEAMEPVILRQYERKGNRLSRHGEVVTNSKYPWAAVTLDAWDDDLKCPVEAKDVGGREPVEVTIERYQAQLHLQMEITGANICALTMSIGAARPITEYIDRDADYAAELMKRGQQFMQHVANRTPPVVLDPVPAPIIADKTVDMSNNETWARHATQWLQVKGAADSARDSEKILKNLVPEDAKKCFGLGVRITRDRANRLSLREDT